MRRCVVCKIELEDNRAGSRYDDICNAAINPPRNRDWQVQGPVPRIGDWQDREQALADLHARLRGPKPGWAVWKLAPLGEMLFTVYNPDIEYEPPMAVTK